MLPLEFLPGAELAGSEQGDEVVELAEIVLQRRCREQQEIVAIELLNELVTRGRVMLDLVLFVDDDEVPSMAQDRFGVSLADGAVVGNDRLRNASPIVRISGRVESLEELALELSLPLGHQGSWREDQDATRQTADRELLEDDSRFDRLAEPHLVGEDVSPAHLAQYGASDLDLVRQLLDRVRVEG